MPWNYFPGNAHTSALQVCFRTLYLVVENGLHSQVRRHDNYYDLALQNGFLPTFTDGKLNCHN